MILSFFGGMSDAEIVQSFPGRMVLIILIAVLFPFFRR